MDKNNHYHLHIRIPKHPVRIVFAAVSVLFVLFILFGSVYRASALKAELFASSCLGNWQNSEFASGLEKDKTQEFSEENSAIFLNTQAQIFCGGFVTNGTQGEMPKNAKIQEVVLALKWQSTDTIENPIVENEVIQEPVLDTSSDMPVESKEPEPETETLLEEVGAVFSRREAFAEEPTEIIEVLPIEVTTEPVLDIPATFVDTGVPEVAEEVPATESELPQSSQIQDGTWFTIRISVDGNTWSDLAKITKSNFADAIVLPVYSMQDISKLKVSIESENGIHDTKVFLDAVILEVTYSVEEIVVVEIPETNFNNPNSSDLKKFSIENVTKGNDIHVSVATDSDQGNSIVISSTKGGNVRFYKDGEKEFSIASAIGEEPLVIPAYQFSPGHFVVVLFDQSTQCNELDIELCRESSGYIGEASFDVIATVEMYTQLSEPPREEPKELDKADVQAENALE